MGKLALFDRIDLPAHLRKFLGRLSESFWILPAALTLLGIVGAVGLVSLDRSGRVPHWLLENAWVYNGGGTGARTLLGAVAASTIGVAGTVFSITIAALSLAAGQMGPRLFRNFTRDRGVQITLGAFLGTFAYALMVRRSRSSPSGGDGADSSNEAGRVFLTSKTGKDMFKHLLLPTDGSPSSEDAIEKAIAFAKDAQAQVTGLSSCLNSRS